jgi:hypothetical protein
MGAAAPFGLLSLLPLAVPPVIRNGLLSGPGNGNGGFAQPPQVIVRSGKLPAGQFVPLTHNQAVQGQDRS